MIEIIICSIDARKFASVTANFKTVLSAVPYEIIGIYDANSLSEGYNRRIAQSRGDIVIFCHDDIEILSPAFNELLCKYLDCYDVFGRAGTDCLIENAWAAEGDPFTHGAIAYPADAAWPCDRYNLLVWGSNHVFEVPGIQALDGLFLAVRRPVLTRVKFDEANFDGFHVYDTDFTFAAFLAGFRLAICKDFLIAHQSGGNYATEYGDFSARFAEKYRGRLTARPRSTSRAALARNLERAGIRRLFEQA